MTYEQKYLKYKQKYLELKNGKFELTGGRLIDLVNPEYTSKIKNECEKIIIFLIFSSMFSAPLAKLDACNSLYVSR